MFPLFWNRCNFFSLASPRQKCSLLLIKTWDYTRVCFSVNKQLFRGRKIPSSKMNKLLKIICFQNGQCKCHCIMKRHRHLTFMEQLLTGHSVHFQTLMPRSVKTNQSPDQHIFHIRNLPGFYSQFSVLVCFQTGQSQLSMSVFFYLLSFHYTLPIFMFPTKCHFLQLKFNLNC